MRKQTVDESIGIQTKWLKDKIKSLDDINKLVGETAGISYRRYGREIINIFTFKGKIVTVKLIIKDNKESRTHSTNDIEIQLEKCTYGNYRLYFKCPYCNDNFTKLYFRGDILGCRKCMRLTYGSSRRSGNKMEEIRYKMIKLHRKLDTEHSMDNLHPNKPKSMHYETYYKLIIELQHLERCFNRIMGDLYFRYGTYKDLTTNEFIERMRP